MDIETKEIHSQTTTLNGQIEMETLKIVAEITNLETTQISSRMTLLSVKTLTVMDMVTMLQEITEMHSNLTQHNGLILMAMDTVIIAELVH